MDNNELLTRAELLLLVGRLAFLGCISVYTLKYMLNNFDPTKQNKKNAHKLAQDIFKKLNLTNIKDSLNEYELVVASQLVDPKSIDVSWKDIGGLDSIIEDIRTEIILPLKSKTIFKSIESPTGVLLHGPPGCGKTMLAKATAHESNARFINLEAALLTDKWYGESQKLTKAVFTLAQKIQPCIIFIDEIDSFLRSRDSNDHEATAMVKAQFMTLWDGLETSRESQVIILGATNRPEDVDRAFLRRMPSMYSVSLPNTQQRKKILSVLISSKECASDVNIDKIAEQTEEFSGADLREMHRGAKMIRVKEYVRQNPEIFEQASSTTSKEVRSITMDDYMKTIRKMVESRHKIGAGTGHTVIGID